MKSCIPKAENSLSLQCSEAKIDSCSLMVSLPVRNANFIGANLNDHKIDSIRIDPSISLHSFYTCN